MDTSLRVEGGALLLHCSSGGARATIELTPDISFRDAQELADRLHEYGLQLRIETETESLPEMTRTSQKEWRDYIATCPCGAEFPDTGLGGLGKHVANCEAGKAELHIGKNGMGAIYRPVVEAIYEWYGDAVFTLPELRERVDGLGIQISYSSIRGHIQWLESEGYLASTKEGRSHRYEFIKAPTELGGGSREEEQGD